MRAATVVFAALVAAGQVEQRTVDPSQSTAKFCIQHIFVTQVCGSVPIVRGALEIPTGSLIPTKVSGVLDAGRIDTGDRDRDASLESPNYFDAKQFPAWTFVSTKIEGTGPASFGIDGTLTLHGTSQPEHLDVTVRGEAPHQTYHALAHIDRRTWGMKGTRLDPAMGNAAEITLDIVLK